ncbi:MAG: TAT-variant-translocated molybdopterin oxidoreductase [Flavobacterium sp.]|nr:TAT-variant-translocated molybdopterin oxidoreductase [Pedobacter sp.]
MDSNKKYWKGLEELKKTKEFTEKNKGEFSEPLPIEEVLNEAGLSTIAPRRDFLKTLGFGLGAVTLAACNKSPIHKAIPYLVKPEEVVPGIPNFYSSSYNGHSILVKTREGRPIKIEGNPSCVLSKGKMSAQGQASVLDLYDVSKLKGPVYNGNSTTWPQLDQYVKGELNKIKANGKKIKIISSTINSPSTKAVIGDFIAQFPNTKHVQVDAISYTGIIKANENSFGVAVIPGYRFDRAELIVSFGADFLGTWISPIEYSRQYASNRNNAALKNKKMSRHIQLEAGMTMTGTNADTRILIKPSEQGIALMNLYAALGGANVSKPLANNPNANKAITLIAKELLAAKGRCLVVCGSNDVSTQILVNAINSLLGSYGTTIDLANASFQYLGNDAEFVSCVNEMKRGEVDAVFFMNANPGYDFINAKEFSDALAKVKLRVSFADRMDETAGLCQIVAPTHHYLESWGDANPVEGFYTILQPTINPINDTRYAEEGFLGWSENPVKDYYQYIQNNWNINVLPQANSTWKQLLQSGSIYFGEKPSGAFSFTQNLSAVFQTINNQSNALAKDGENAIELILYENVAVGDGKHANNPWLQELPDPVSKVTWDNYIAIAPKFAEKLGIGETDLAEVKTGRYSLTLPVLIQPGQAAGTVSIALGYGRTKVGKAGNEVGKNAYPFLSFENGTFQFTSAATISKVGGTYELAQTQTHHTIEGRNIIREATLKDYLKDPYSGTGKGHAKTYDLWDRYEHPGHNWVMAIDLNACTGCGACIVACSAENNIPVVGRDEVRRRREMHWIRIDRYYTYNEGAEKVTEENEIKQLENLDNVTVIHQPMLCQHCEHAPCETVCPVIATMHSSEGLNHMAYNRCIGTRYCANNCPYKVRRFNWFNYWNDSRFDNYLNNEFTQLVLNPDVTPRSRGVMEKCSMCIQRIQGGKLKAKLERRTIKDGEILTACQQTCPTNAIIFGDSNDPKSAVSKALTSERTYYVLEEINTLPGVGYQTKIRNIAEA